MSIESLNATGLGFLGPRMQLGFVVKDLEAALRYWTNVLKVGPFVVIENAVAGRRVMYRGSQTRMEVALAFSYVGDVQIELVYACNDAPSQYKDFLAEGREGLHHVGYWPEKFEAACLQLDASGFSETSSIFGHDGKRVVVHYDSPAHIGAMIELVPLTAERLTFLSKIQSLTENWDGTHPIRRYASGEAFLKS
jgi:hypothetical protein